MNIDDAKSRYPNNYDLGEFFRRNPGALQDEEILKDFPNNYDLGRFIRQDLN